jgi:hypothetical protein
MPTSSVDALRISVGRVQLKSGEIIGPSPGGPIVEIAVTSESCAKATRAIELFNVGDDLSAT